jgi:hypothetical protein
VISHFNLLAILLSTLTFIISGSLLYNPIHPWGRFWAKEAGMLNKEHNMSAGDMFFTFGGTAVGGLLLSLALGQVTYWFNKFDHDGWMMTSLQVAFLLWLGVFAVATFVNAAYASQSKKLIGLHLLNGAIELLLMGLVIGLFPVTA